MGRFSRIGQRGGFKNPRRAQGGWIGAAIALVGSLYSSNKASKDKKEANKQLEKSDPFGKYRDQYAQDINALMDDPSSIAGTAEYKSRQQAAARLMASQGYTGSGNALAAAAEAGGASYQQAFDNLARLAGVDAVPGGSAAALGGVQAARANSLGATAGVVNNAANLASTIFNKSASG